jgi:Na+-translocating ferredoxin:NAD+ oxidoreductase RnfD subunit
MKTNNNILSTPKGGVNAGVSETRSNRNQTKQKGINLKKPKSILIAILLIIMGITAFGSGGKEGILNTGVAVLAAVIVDLILAVILKHKIKFPDGAILTGLIIGLVLSSSVPLYQTAITATVAILSKHFLKIKKKPIFNPAAFGLYFVLLIFSSGQSWWGGFPLLPSWCIILLLISGYLITEKVNKFPQVFAFLGTYFLIYLILALTPYSNTVDALDALRNPYINSVLFLAFFMLTDPPTSPAKYKDQVWFGIIVAVVSIIDYALFQGLAYLLVGLLFGNAWKAWQTNRKTKGSRN